MAAEEPKALYAARRLKGGYLQRAAIAQCRATGRNSIRKILLSQKGAIFNPYEQIKTINFLN
ncbi:hypothetical protein [Roseovarius sp. MMSF_3305]|uniref:hypothetical protein n=1 Tax=Roseovarius sp. MMSF_3305 TaxID=3046697 RepID=UPI00273EDDED|nr:hypothetical protein [Roseovarius sp. MMSF_3305]